MRSTVASSSSWSPATRLPPRRRRCRGNGTNYDDWGYFFRPGQQQAGGDPVLPVSGNHEEDADWLYQFTDIPHPTTTSASTTGTPLHVSTARLVEYSEASKGHGRDGQGVGPAPLLREDRVTPRAAPGGSSSTTTALRLGRLELAPCARSGRISTAGVDLVFAPTRVRRSHRIRAMTSTTAPSPCRWRRRQAGGASEAIVAHGPSRAVPHVVHVSIAGPTLEMQAVDMDGHVFDHMLLR